MKLIIDIYCPIQFHSCKFLLNSSSPSGHLGQGPAAPPASRRAVNITDNLSQSQFFFSTKKKQKRKVVKGGVYTIKIVKFKYFGASKYDQRSFGKNADVSKIPPTKHLF